MQVRGMVLLTRVTVTGAANLCFRLCERACPVCRVILSFLETQARALASAVLVHCQNMCILTATA